MRGGEKDERKTEFPFLIGTVRTVFGSISSPVPNVSIPHRYGKNQ